MNKTNVADDQHVKEGKKRQRRSEIIAEASLKHVLSTREGRRFVWNLLERAGVYASSFSSDTNTTMFKEGKRSNGLELLASIMSINPEAFSLMSKEKREDEEDERRGE